MRALDSLFLQNVDVEKANLMRGKLITHYSPDPCSISAGVPASAYRKSVIITAQFRPNAVNS
jgi:hypothetical protein